MQARDGDMVPPPKSKLGIGVSWDPKRGGKHYKARIYVRSKELNVGRFATPLEAQLAHDQAVSLLPPDELRPRNFPQGQGQNYNNPDVERRVLSFLERFPANRPNKVRSAARLAPAAGAASPPEPSDASASDVAVLLRDQQQDPWMHGMPPGAAAARPTGAHAAAASFAMSGRQAAAAVAYTAPSCQQPLHPPGVPLQSAGVQAPPTAAGPRAAHFVFFPDQLEQQLQQQLQQQLKQQQQHLLQHQRQLQQELQQQHSQLQLQHQQLKQQRQQLRQLEEDRARMLQQQRQHGVQDLQPLSQPQQQQQQQQQAGTSRPAAPAKKNQPTDQQVQQVLKLVMQLVRQ